MGKIQLHLKRRHLYLQRVVFSESIKVGSDSYFASLYLCYQMIADDFFVVTMSLRFSQKMPQKMNFSLRLPVANIKL